MPKLKHKKPKTGVISVRVDPKLRYGLDLAARQQHISVSDAVVQAVAAYLASKGLMDKQEDKNLPLLDLIWDESESKRIVNLAQKLPSLASREDIMLFSLFKDMENNVFNRGVKWLIEQGESEDNSIEIAKYIIDSIGPIKSPVEYDSIMEWIDDKKPMDEWINLYFSSFKGVYEVMKKIDKQYRG